MILYTGSLSQREFIGVTRALRSGRDKVAIESLLKPARFQFSCNSKNTSESVRFVCIYICTHDSCTRVSSTLIKKISMPIVVKLHEGTSEGNVITRSKVREEGKFFAKKTYLS